MSVDTYLVLFLYLDGLTYLTCTYFISLLGHYCNLFWLGLESGPGSRHGERCLD